MNDETDHNDSDALSWSDIKSRVDGMTAPPPAIRGLVLQAKYQINIVLEHVDTLRASDEKIVRAMRKVRSCVEKISAYLADNGLPQAFAPPRSLYARLRDDDYEVVTYWRPRSSRRQRPSAP